VPLVEVASEQIATSMSAHVVGLVLRFIGARRLAADLRTTLQRLPASSP
jgi:hypothetical protein